MNAGRLVRCFGAAIVVSLAAATLQADPLDHWTWLYPQPQGYTLAAVTYGNGLYVVVGEQGTIVTSSDGYHWTNQTYGQFPNLLGVGYAAGSYAAVGEGGVVLTSPDGISWTQRISPTTNTLRSVAGNPTYPANGGIRFIAAGDRGTLIYADDSATWLDGGSGSYGLGTNDLRGVSFGGGDATVVGDNGTFLTFWTHSPPNQPGTTNNLRAFASGNGRYVTGGSSIHYEQNWSCPYPGCPRPNATLLYFQNPQWIKTPLNAWYGEDWFTVSGLAFGNNRFVAVGYTAFTLEYNYPGMITISDNGTNWTGLPLETSENRLYGVVYGDGRFVAVGDAGAILVSTNGSDWTEISPYHRTAITAIACTERLCIVSGSPMHRYLFSIPDFSTLVSSNGVDWVISTTNLPPMSDLLGVGNRFVGVSDNCIYTTTNGFDWATNCVSATTLHSVGFGNGQFFVTGDSGAIYTSSDGLSWSNRSVITTGSFDCAAYGDGLFVAAGTEIATSRDALTWTLHPTNPPARLARIVHANRMFVAAGNVGQFLDNGTLLSSTDGLNWTIRYAMAGKAAGIAYANGTYLAISSGAPMIRSSDGINWVPTSASLPQVDNGAFRIYYPYGFSPPLCARQGRFLAAGLDGILMQSGDTRVPIVSGSTRMTPLGFEFYFNPQIGELYRIQTSTDLDFWENAYQAVGNQQPTGFIDFTSTTSPKRFFRVVSP